MRIRVDGPLDPPAGKPKFVNFGGCGLDELMKKSVPERVKATLLW